MSEATMVAPLVEAANNLLVARYIARCMGFLPIYDHLLTLDDEVSYVWRGKKTWMSYLFFASRYLLLVSALVTQTASGQSQQDQCTRGVLISSTLTFILLISSDIFILLRVYAVTGRNNFVALYLSSLVCAKAITGSINLSQMRVNAIPLPEIPIAAFKTCTASGPPHLQITLQAISVVFDISAFSIIIFSASFGAVNVRFSSILRTILADATVHFIMAMILQTLVLLFMSLADTTTNQFPVILQLVLTPMLINRAVLSLKKAADSRNGTDQARGTRHFSAVKFEPRPSVASRLPDDPLETRLDIYGHNDIALDELGQHAGP